MAAGVGAAIPIVIWATVSDRKIIALNINNGIVLRLAYEFGMFMIGLCLFGLFCGICWIMLEQPNRPAKDRRPTVMP
jgi:hypothetical protein